MLYRPFKILPCQLEFCNKHDTNSTETLSASVEYSLGAERNSLDTIFSN